MKKALVFAVVLAFFGSAPGAWGHQTDKESPETGRHDHAALQDEAPPPYIGIEEKLGATVPLDLTFIDEDGRKVRLGDLIDKPTIVSFIYYKCRDVCPLLLGGEAEVLRRLDAVPGKEYTALTVSVDELDTPADAREKKKNFLQAIGKPYPAEAWRFLTGDKENIQKFTDAVGFRFRRHEDIFQHSISLIVLSGQGKIVRYLYGKTFLPFDLKMAFLEASEGRVGPTISKVLLYCFTYDPKGKKYVFNILKVFGTVMVVFLGGFFIFLTRAGKRRTPKEGKGA